MNETILDYEIRLRETITGWEWQVRYEGKVLGKCGRSAWWYAQGIKEAFAEARAAMDDHHDRRLDGTL